MFIKKKYKNEKYTFIKSISHLLKAQINIIEALSIVMNNYNNDFKKMIFRVQKSLEKGETLFKSFSNLFIENDILEMIKIADETGKMSDVFENIYRKYEFKRYIKKEVTKLSLYPLTVIFTAVIVILILFNTVVPKFKQMYEDIGSELPTITKNVIFISDIINKYLYLFIIFLLLFILLLKKYIANNKIKTEEYLIKNRFFGKIIKEIKILNLTQNMYSLMKANIDIADSLLICINGETTYMKKELQIIRHNILKGQTVTNSFSKSILFDNEYNSFIKIGDSTGDLTQSFYILKNIYDERVKERMSIILKIFEPVSIIFIGIILAIIVFSLMLPMMRIGEIITI